MYLNVHNKLSIMVVFVRNKYQYNILFRFGTGQSKITSWDEYANGCLLSSWRSIYGDCSLQRSWLESYTSSSLRPWNTDNWMYMVNLSLVRKYRNKSYKILPLLFEHRLLPESVRWLQSQNRMSEVIDVLAKVANSNGKVLLPHVRESLMASTTVSREIKSPLIIQSKIISKN